METITLHFYHKGIQFDSITDLLRMYKTYGYPSEKIINEYLFIEDKRENPLYKGIFDLVENDYNTKIKPFTKEEIIEMFPNKEQQKVLMEAFDDVLKTYEYTVSTNTIWTSFDYGEVEAYNEKEAFEKAEDALSNAFNKANAALALNPITKGMSIEFDSSQIQVNLKK